MATGIRVLLLFTVVNILMKHDTSAQMLGDGKRRASEYFCVAQCLGLLNPGSPGGPDKSACYEPPVFCANPKFSNAFTCCKDYPNDIFKNAADIYNKCKVYGFPNTPPLRLLQSYVVNTATGNSGKIDMELLARSWGKQMCYLECAFVEVNKLLGSDGNLNVEEAKKAFAVGSAYTNVINSAVETCNSNIRLNYSPLPNKIKLTYDTVPRDCNPFPLLLHQCVRRKLLTEPCTAGQSGAVANSTDCDLLLEIRKCDPFKAS